MNDPNGLLVALHRKLTASLLALLKEEHPSPAHLREVREFLKDNHITAAELDSKPREMFDILGEIEAEELPFA